jgi:hypothetical protein
VTTPADDARKRTPRNPLTLDPEGGILDPSPPPSGPKKKRRRRIKLDTLADVVREQRRVYREMVNGGISVEDGRSFVWALSQVAATLEKGGEADGNRDPMTNSEMAAALLRVLAPHLRRPEGAPDRPGLPAPEGETIEGEIVLPPARRREKPPPVALGSRLTDSLKNGDRPFRNPLADAGERALKPAAPPRRGGEHS